MPNASEHPARGKVVETKPGLVVFAPSNTNYQLHLSGDYTGSVNTPIDAVIRVTARKIYTVPSGGNFITPIFGPPRIIQGRVVSADEKTLLVHAGTSFLVDLPAEESGLDLANGPIRTGALVNVVALPGARIERL